MSKDIFAGGFVENKGGVNKNPSAPKPNFIPPAIPNYGKGSTAKQQASHNKK